MITLATDFALLEDGFARDMRIGVTGGAITGIVHGPAEPGDERIDGVLLPGMANLHSHAFQRVFAGRSEHTQGGEDFWSWREAMYRTAACMTPDLYIPIMAWLCKELLKGGYTSHAEFHYLHHRPDGTPYAPPTAMAEALAAGAAQAGMALTLLVGIYETGGFDGAPLSGGQNRFRNNAAAALRMAGILEDGHGDLVVGLALHSLRAVPPAALDHAVRDFSGRGPIHIHVAEQQAEVQACVTTLGAPPVAWLLDHAPVDHTWCLVHATHATEAEIKAAARAGAVIGLCPSTEADLGDGIYDFPAHLAADGNFGIGSDSNVLLDAFGELRLLEYGQRLRAERRNVAACGSGHTGRALWQAAAAGGAAACGRPAGRIATGHRADFVVIAATPETAAAPADHILDAAIFSPTRAPARHVMSGGTWLVRDGAHRNEAAIDTAYATALKALA